ncbi:ferredoxin--NADP reductase [Vibrio sp. 99-70-13A1]|uniref:ferredoxin--NADP reductase n=1 Tax=Vibrio sp. 99-70-13A1 TaxID=2607601 RepID=UPI00149389F9|nr:ferredoxin--NADP reductase [Vibrio sp. 99-70-13A1]NOH97207.1 ferredoxin--NADP reductase [Vibrio sp. 99-70-13A1]
MDKISHGIPHGLVQGKVTQKIEWNDQLFSLHVHAPVAPYLAGQFTKLALPVSTELQYQQESNDLERPEYIRRAYSMVNSPSHSLGHQHLEFLIVKDTSGQLSPKLHELKIHDTIFVGKDPSGFMILEEIPPAAKDFWMLATGTAIGPFIAMLETPHMADRFANLILVHAVRTQQDLTYQSRIAQLVHQFQGKLRYVPIISRESITGTLRGRIPTLLLRGELEHATSIAIHQQHSFFYLCGNPAMVRDTSEALKQLGLNKHLRRQAGQFSSENYW